MNVYIFRPHLITTLTTTCGLVLNFDNKYEFGGEKR